MLYVVLLRQQLVELLMRETSTQQVKGWAYLFRLGHLKLEKPT